MRPNITFKYPYRPTSENFDEKRDDQECFNNGLYNMLQGRYSDAVMAFTVATQKTGHMNAEVFIDPPEESGEHGESEDGESEDEESEKIEEETVKMRIPNANAYRWRGHAYCALKDYQHAIGDYERAIEHSDKNNCYHPVKNDAIKDLATLHCYRAMVFLTTGNYGDAITNFSKAHMWNEKIFQKYIKHDYRLALLEASYSELDEILQTLHNNGEGKMEFGQADAIKVLMYKELRPIKLQKHKLGLKRFEAGNKYLDSKDYNWAFDEYNRIEPKLLLELTDGDEKTVGEKKTDGDEKNFLKLLEEAIEKIDEKAHIVKIKSNIMELFGEERPERKIMLGFVHTKEAEIYFPIGNKYLMKGNINSINWAFNECYCHVMNGKMNVTRLGLKGFEEALKKHSTHKNLDKIKSKIEAIKDNIPDINTIIANAMLLQVNARKELLNELTKGFEKLSNGNDTVALDIFSTIKETDEALLIESFRKFSPKRMKAALKKIGDFTNFKTKIAQLLQKDSVVVGNILKQVVDRECELQRELENGSGSSKTFFGSIFSIFGKNSVTKEISDNSVGDGNSSDQEEFFL